MKTPFIVAKLASLASTGVRHQHPKQVKTPTPRGWDRVTPCHR